MLLLSLSKYCTNFYLSPWFILVTDNISVNSQVKRVTKQAIISHEEENGVVGLVKEGTVDRAIEGEGGE